MTMENLKLYNIGREVPENAKKPINAGRLKGMTDINPMWRIKRLTEMFGACGVGWWYEITHKEIVHDDYTKQKAAFVDIKLYYIDLDTGHASHGIFGTGGASFVAQEKNGPYMSDECFKMALTDAISVAAKALGIGADVYFGKDRTKYNAQEDQPEQKMETVEDAANFVLTFGQYKGKTLGEIYKTDRGYLERLDGNEKTDPIIKKGISILIRAVIASRGNANG
jgi:hypothetical protein